MTTPYLSADVAYDENAPAVLRPPATFAAGPDPISGGAPWTIAFGHTGPDVHEGLVIPYARGLDLLAEDLGWVQAELDKRLAWWRDLSDPRQDVVVNMSFNLGVGGQLGFRTEIADLEAAIHDALQAAQAADYDAAAAAILNSHAAAALPRRYGRLALQMRTGARQDPALYQPSDIAA